MTARRTRRRTTPDRTPLLAGSAVVLVLAGAGVPFVAVEVARAQLAADPCAGGSASGPPSDRFYSAVALLDRLSSVPVVGGRAAEIARLSTAQCAETWVSACELVQAPAIEAARGAQEARLGLADGEAAPDASTAWRDHIDRSAATQLCGSWAAWAAWVDEHGLEAAVACPVCAPE